MAPVYRIRLAHTDPATAAVIPDGNVALATSETDCPDVMFRRIGVMLRSELPMLPHWRRRASCSFAAGMRSPGAIR